MSQHQNGSMVGISMAMAWHWQPVLKASAPSHVLFWNRRHHWHRQPLQPDTLLGATNQLLANFCHPCLSFFSGGCQRQQPFVREKLPKSKAKHLQGWVRQCGTQREVGEGVGVRFASKSTNEANSIFSNRQSELFRLQNSAKALLCYLAKKFFSPCWNVWVNG